MYSYARFTLVLPPVPNVLGAKHISNPIFGAIRKKDAMLSFEIYWPKPHCSVDFEVALEVREMTLPAPIIQNNFISLNNIRNIVRDVVVWEDTPRN